MFFPGALIAIIGVVILIQGKADGAAGQIGFPIPARIIGKAVVSGPNTACTETFLRVGPFNK